MVLRSEILTKKSELPTPDQALPGRESAMPVPEAHFVNGRPLTAPFPAGLQQVLFGMGCFWGAERRLWQQPGVWVTAVGYAGGYTPNPTYDEVCSGLTGHSEVVLVVYNPQETSFEQLLKVFWEAHDPTQGMRQGGDIGTQYRSVIYTFDAAQKAAALASRESFQAELAKAGYDRITTEIADVPPFYYAEAYHQQYLAKNPNGKIPVLELEDGSFLWESNAILNFLADGSALLPSEPRLRTQVLQWQFFEQYSHEPYVVIAAGDGVYKLDYNKVLEYHIEKKADITVVCKDMEDGTDVTRFGCVKLNDDGRITDFEEKPMASDATTISCGIYVIRRRQLIELLERCAAEDRYDLVNDILVRYKNLKRIYAYKLNGYWNNIASVDSYYKTNMDFLKPEVRDYFFKQYPDVYTKIDDLPPAKYNPGAIVRNSLISSGCILNGTVENSILFKKAYVGNNCVIKNSIILNDVYIGDNTVIENCIVESRDTIRANTTHIGTPENIKIVVEKNERYTL